MPLMIVMYDSCCAVVFLSGVYASEVRKVIDVVIHDQNYPFFHYGNLTHVGSKTI